MKKAVVLPELLNEIQSFLQHLETVYYDRQLLVCHPIYKNMVFVPTEVANRLTITPKITKKQVCVSDILYTSFDKKSWRNDFSKLNSRVKSAQDFYVTDLRMNVLLGIEFFMLKDLNEYLDAKIAEFSLVPFSGWTTVNIGKLQYVTLKDLEDEVKKEQLKVKKEEDEISNKNDERIMRFVLKDQQRKEYLRELDILSKQKTVNTEQFKKKLKDLQTKCSISDIDSIIYEAAFLGKIFSVPDLTQKNAQDRKSFVLSLFTRIQSLKIEDRNVNNVLQEIKKLELITPSSFKEHAERYFGTLFVVSENVEKQQPDHTTSSTKLLKDEQTGNVGEVNKGNRVNKRNRVKKVNKDNKINKVNAVLDTNKIETPQKLDNEYSAVSGDKQQKNNIPIQTSNNSKTPKNKKSKLVAWILLLFLGVFGLHRTYLGQFWKGCLILAINIAGIFGYFIPNMIVFLFEVAIMNKNVDKINDVKYLKAS